MQNKIYHNYHTHMVFHLYAYVYELLIWIADQNICRKYHIQMVSHRYVYVCAPVNKMRLQKT